MAERLDAHQPGLRPALGDGGVALAVDVEAAMRAGADAGIFVAAPIDEIVPALGARPGMVGDFVGGKAGGGAHRLRRIPKQACGVFVGHGELAGRLQRVKRRVGLDRELVEREMFAGFVDRTLELGGPGLRRLPLPRVDEVE
jgi:hypothetical protein